MLHTRPLINKPMRQDHPGVTVPRRSEIRGATQGEQRAAELAADRVDPPDGPCLRGRVAVRGVPESVHASFDREGQLARLLHRDPVAWTAPYRVVRREAALRIIRFMLAVAVCMMLAATVHPDRALAHPLRHQRSSNWAGYAITTADPVRSVSGRWVQPAASCDQHAATYAAFWVGLGGFKQDSQKLEQIGTESDCTASDQTKDYSWYELVPHAPVKIPGPVHPGDRIAARVSLTGDLVRLWIRNVTDRRTFAKTIGFAAPDATSAEWIAEAPSDCGGPACEPLPLTDFNTVQFSAASATTAGGHVGTITNSAYSATELTLEPGAGALGPPPADAQTSPGPVSLPQSPGASATPTRPSRHGADFAVHVK
jgi:hypothetical protein